MGKDAFSSHLPRPGQSCPQLWGSCGGVWKPPDIYSRYNRHAINTILHYMLGFFSFLFFIPSFHLSFSPLYSFFFNPSSFLMSFFIIFFVLFFISFLHLVFFFSSFLIIIKQMQFTSSYN